MTEPAPGSDPSALSTRAAKAPGGWRISGHKWFITGADGAALFIILAGYNYNTLVSGVSAFWLILAVAMFFVDGGFAIVGPYAAEVWPSHLRTSGMGSAYGFGGIGKILGPVGLALIVGSSNYLKPDVPLTQIPTAFLYLGCWFLMAGVVYYFFGVETRGKSNEQIDRELAAAD